MDKMELISTHILVKLIEVWLDWEQYGTNQCKTNQHNQQFSVQSIIIIFVFFKCHIFIDNFIDFYLFMLA